MPGMITSTLKIRDTGCRVQEYKISWGHAAPGDTIGQLEKCLLENWGKSGSRSTREKKRTNI